MSTDSLTSLSGRGRAVHGEVVVRGYVFVGHGDPQVCREKHACECVLSALIALPRRSQFTRWTQQRVRAGLLNARCPSCHDLRAKVSTPEHLVLIGPRSIRHTPDNLPTKQPAPAACSCKPQAETVRVQMLAVMW